jgi:hypothetical protein
MNGHVSIVLTVLEVLGKFCVAPLVTEVTISPYTIKLACMIESHRLNWLNLHRLNLHN